VCVISRGASTPHGTPGGPQVESKILVAQHFSHFKQKHILMSISFSRPNVSCPFYYRLFYNYQFMGISRNIITGEIYMVQK